MIVLLSTIVGEILKENEPYNMKTGNNLLQDVLVVVVLNPYTYLVFACN